jgi:hypothetical protein
MIRINLLQQKTVKRGRGPRKATGKGELTSGPAAIFLAVLVIESAGLYFWYSSVESKVQDANVAQAIQHKKKNELKQRKKQLIELQKVAADVVLQSNVFESLEHGKRGPLHLLLYLSYALRRVDMSLPADEYELLGNSWKTAKRPGSARDGPWDPNRIWVTEIEEINGAVTILGSALDHVDVTQFQERLKAGIYFDGVTLSVQEIQMDERLKKEYVDFKLECELNYNPAGYPAINVSGGAH